MHLHSEQRPAWAAEKRPGLHEVHDEAELPLNVPAAQE